MARIDALPLEHPMGAGVPTVGMGRGCIPYRLRIGVTGHITLPDEALMVTQVNQVLGDIRRLIPQRPATPVLVTVVSPLAEGADRLVARTILDDGAADLDAVLPLPLAEYIKDFPGSQTEFLALYRKAATTITLPNPVPWEQDPVEARKRAYLQVGKYVVDHCDVLIALWDGRSEQGTGGTAAVVRYADKRGRPLVWINSVTGAVMQKRFEPEPGADRSGDDTTGLRWDALDALDMFNRATIPSATLEREEAAKRKFFVPPTAGPDVASVPFPALAEWLLPFFVRADELAVRSQKRHHWLGTPVFLLAAGAVASAGAQAVFDPEGKLFLSTELGCIFALIVVVLVGMRLRPGRRWLTYRFLAERFRSAFFLAAAGFDDPNVLNPEGGTGDDASTAWVSRAYAEVWKQRPRVEPDHADLRDLRIFLVKAWIGSQRDYHGHRGHRFGQFDRWLTGGTLALLGITLVFPILHLTGVGRPDLPSWFSFASISLPAVGAALTGISEQREFELLAERYEAMNDGLADEAERMEEADDVLEAIWSVAAHTEALMRQENRDWFGVMRFRDIRPHV